MRFDPLSRDLLLSPYDAYAWLRDHDPVHRVELADGTSYVMLTRFADVWEAARDHGTFSSAQGLTFYPDEIGQLGLPPTLVMLDPPRQVELRRLIGAAFTPKRVTDLEPLIRSFVRERLAALTPDADGVVDLHQQFSNPIPTFVLATLLGVEGDDRDRFDPWVRALVSLADNGFGLDGQAALDSVAEMMGFFSDQIKLRRERPGADLVSALAAAEVDGERLTDWDILGFCFVMVAGGNDTTANLISHSVMLLDADDAARDQRAELAADSSLIPGALMEVLRLEGSVQGLARTTTRDVDLHGMSIPEGTKVMLMYAAANRDPREFGGDVDTLNIKRNPLRHLGFSSGVHFCIGSHLARLQARVALEELLAVHPTWTVDLAGSERLVSPFVRGWTSLPVRLG